MAYQVNHVGGNSSGWTLIDGDAWETVDYPGVGLGLEVLAGGDVVASFAPGKWSAICPGPRASGESQLPGTGAFGLARPLRPSPTEGRP